LRSFDLILGLRLGEEVAAERELDGERDPKIDGLLAERQRARESKDWATADRIRDELAALKIEIVDTPEGARWRRVAGDSG
jgi:cysteinyl-tRNA synthetase